MKDILFLMFRGKIMHRLQQKEPWNFNKNGTEAIYKPDKEHMKCPQSELSDEYGTPEEVQRAAFYEYEHLINDTLLFSNSIAMLIWIQKGLSKEKFPHIIIEKPKRIEVGTALQIANHVHNTLDWLRACQKRKWDGRPMNSCDQILPYCLKGLYINSATLLHYDENPERH